jgi:lysophospholipase L1-like esterase
MGNAFRRIKRVLVFLRTSWSIVGITLVVLCVTESSFRLIFALKDRWSAATRPDRRVLVDGYGGETWPVQHYRELESLQERWEPYVYFRPKPFRGQTVTIGDDGLRATWKAPSPTPGGPDPKPVKILMLGGSSLWGFGARDDQTIPSLMARDLNRRKCDVQVRNLAAIGYVNTQEVVALVRELQSGYRPDLVIFYDGVNDTTSALLEGEAGLTTNESNRRREFNLLQSPSRLVGSLLSNLIKESGSYRFALSVRTRLSGGNAKSGRALDDAMRDRLAREVVLRFQSNIEIVERLGREFQFRSLFFWQPVIFTKPALVPFEREEAERYAWTEPMFREVLRQVRESADLRSDPAFHDLSRVFDDSSGLVFIDYCHTTESANARIATAIAEKVAAELPGIRPGQRKPPDGDGEPRPASVN